MFSIKLKELRENADLSQYALADKLGVAQSTVGGWESGAREPNFDMIKKIAGFFNTTTDSLLGNSALPKQGKKAPPDEQMALFLKQKLNSLGIGAPDRDLTDEELKALLEIARNNKDFIVWRAKQLAEDRDK